MVVLHVHVNTGRELQVPWETPEPTVRVTVLRSAGCSSWEATCSESNPTVGSRTRVKIICSASAGIPSGVSPSINGPLSASGSFARTFASDFCHCCGLSDFSALRDKDGSGPGERGEC